jgi:N-formylglutamate amidohydrolase
MIPSEARSIADDLMPAFEIARPVQCLGPVVFCSPHSGRMYPRAFLAASRLSPLALRKSEDCYVDQLLDDVVALGAPVISARFPRAFVDANREPYELDPALFLERPPAFANTQSVRVAGGLGTIPRLVADAEEIYPHRLPLSVAFERIERYYHPFHQALADLLQEQRSFFGRAILIDCHSMPSASSDPSSGQRPHFVLGDRFGVACDPRLTRFVRDTLLGYGYSVQLNRPYAGGFITEHYGKPAAGIEALQIEINRGLYLNEATLEKTAGFAGLKLALTAMAGALIEWALPPAARQAVRPIL